MKSSCPKGTKSVEQRKNVEKNEQKGFCFSSFFQNSHSHYYRLMLWHFFGYTHLTVFVWEHFTLIFRGDFSNIIAKILQQQ